MAYKKISVIYRTFLLAFFSPAFIAYLTKPNWWDSYFPFHFLLLLIFVLTSDISVIATKERRFKNLIIKYGPSQLAVILPLVLICALLIQNYSKIDFVEFTVLLSALIYGSSLIRFKIEPVKEANDNKISVKK
jgi:hypothetical protein